MDDNIAPTELIHHTDQNSINILLLRSWVTAKKTMKYNHIIEKLSDAKHALESPSVASSKPHRGNIIIEIVDDTKKPQRGEIIIEKRNR